MNARLVIGLFALSLCACPASGPNGAETPKAAKKADAPAHAASRPASQPAKKAGPEAAKLGLGPDLEIRTSPEDRCPVCAMMPHKNPKFASGLELEDGRTFYTCGTGCFLRAHLHPEVYLGATNVKRRAVPDYFSGKALDAMAAQWVTGSDVVGPMGPAPVVLTSKEDVDTFRRRHGGEHVFTLEGFDDARFEAVTGKPAIRK